MGAVFIRETVLLAFHRQEKLIVGLGLFQLVDQELDRCDFVHRVQQLAQNPHALQFIISSSSRRVPDLFRLMAG